MEVWAKLALPYSLTNENQRYATGTSNPPGKFTEEPALVVNRYGEGKAMYNAADLERMTEEQQRCTLAALLGSLMPESPLFVTNAPKPVELTMFHQPDHRRYVVSLINFQSEMPNIPVHDIELALRWDHGDAPAQVLLLPDERETAFEREDCYVRFRLPRLDTFLMFAICY